MAQGLEAICRKILTQFKLLELAKESERLLRRNKMSEIKKYLQRVKFRGRFRVSQVNCDD